MSIENEIDLSVSSSSAPCMKLISKNLEKNMPQLINLPNEILEKIFDHVSFDDLFILEQVSQIVKNIVLNIAWPRRHTLSHESIIKYTDYDELNDENRFKQISKLVKSVLYRTNILHLNLSINYNHSNSDICSLLVMAPQLLSLYLSGFSVTINSLNNIAHHCHLLEKLSLQNCKMYFKNLDPGFASIFAKCPNLKYINVAKNEINGECFNSIPIQCKLKYLNIFWDDYKLNIHSLNVLAERAINLETLILGNVSGIIINLNEWLNNFPKLRFLEIHDNHSSNPLDFSNMKRLEMLNLGNRCCVKDLTFASFQHCPNLKSIPINVYDLYDNYFVLETLKKCKKLKYCYFDKFWIFQELLDFIQDSKIQYLGIGYWRECKDSENLVRSLFTECDSLTHLEFYFPHRFKPTLESILNEENFPQNRKNKLKLAVQDYHYEKDRFNFPSSCDWIEYVPWEYLESPFFYLTDVRNGYHKEKAAVEE